MAIEKEMVADHEKERIAEFLRFAIELAREAGDKTATGRSTARVVSRDQTAGLVTDADEANTVLIVDRIKERFPEFGILTEELSKAENDNQREGPPPEYEVVVDEVDGSNNLSRGFNKSAADSPDWSVAIGLRHKDGEGIVGVVYIPDHSTLYSALKGKGTFMEKRGEMVPLHVSGADSKDRFIMSFNVNISPVHLAGIMTGVEESGEINKLKPRIRESSALELCYVAGGTDDAFLHTKTQTYDVVAGMVIAKEAGAQVSWLDNKTLLVSNGQIHEPLENIITGALKKN